MKDRIEKTYDAIDDMISFHNTERPKRFGGGIWNAEEEFELYKKQIGDRYTELQWRVIETYFKIKFKEHTKK